MSIQKADDAAKLALKLATAHLQKYGQAPAQIALPSDIFLLFTNLGWKYALNSQLSPLEVESILASQLAASAGDSVGLLLNVHQAAVVALVDAKEAAKETLPEDAPSNNVAALPVPKVKKPKSK